MHTENLYVKNALCGYECVMDPTPYCINTLYTIYCSSQRRELTFNGENASNAVVDSPYFFGCVSLDL